MSIMSDKTELAVGFAPAPGPAYIVSPTFSAFTNTALLSFSMEAKRDFSFTKAGKLPSVILFSLN